LIHYIKITFGNANYQRYISYIHHFRVNSIPVLSDLLLLGTGDTINAHKILVEKKTYAKKPLGRPKRRWGVNTELDLKEMGRENRFN